MNKVNPILQVGEIRRGRWAPEADPFWSDLVDITPFNDCEWGTVCEKTEQLISNRMDIFKEGICEVLDEDY